MSRSRHTRSHVGKSASVTRKKTFAVLKFCQLNMAQKCVRNGCGKTFTDTQEKCVYHPGPPIFHEGQKGVWTPFSWPIRDHLKPADSIA